MRPAARRRNKYTITFEVAALSLVNPLICGAMFAQIEAGETSATRLADATKAAVAVLVILVVAALVGARVLQVFGVSLEAFSIAGGGVLTWIGFFMLRGGSPQAQDPRRMAPLRSDRSRRRSCSRPSPGTITGVITLAVAHAKLALPVTALVAIVVAAVVMWIVMVLVARDGSRASGGLLHDTATRFMALIVVAMGVQFALTGVRDFFTAHP